MKKSQEEEREEGEGGRKYGATRVIVHGEGGTLETSHRDDTRRIMVRR